MKTKPAAAFAPARLSAFAAIAFLSLAPALANETTTYTYDARGRLIQVSHAGTAPNNGVSASYTYDKADNRSNVTVTGAGGVTLTLSPTTLPGGTVGTVYSQTVTASGGTSPYTYSVSSGAVPAGLTLSSGGMLSGTPTTAQTATFTVQATDSASHTGTQAYSVTIGGTTNHPPVANPDTLSVGPCGSGTVNVVANDTDPDGDAITLVSVSGGTYGTASLFGTSSVQYSADVAGKTDIVTYTIQDAHGATANGTLTVTIRTGVCP